MSRPGKMITLYPLGFGAAGVKERIKRVLKYKKPGFWKMTAGIVCILGVSVCFLTDPKTAVDVESYETYMADINAFNLSIDKYSVENASISELAAGDEFEIREDRLYYIVLDNVNDVPDVEYQRGQIFSMDLDRGTIIEHPDYDFSCSRLATRTYEYGMLGCVDPVDESGQWRPGKIQYFDNITGDLRTVVEMDKNGYIAEYAMADEYIVYLYYTWEDSDLISKLVIEKNDGTEKNEIDFSPVD